MPTLEITTDQYHAGTAARAQAVADLLTDDGWLDMVTAGPMILFPTLLGSDAARLRVEAVAAMFDNQGREL